MQGQVKELLSNYGPIGLVWFDDGGSFKGTMENRTNGVHLIHAQEMLDLIHATQPWCIVNNRLGLPADYLTPEQKIPTNGLPGDWETCMTLNKHWGYNKNDNNWKSATTVVSNLVDIASKGGNYLLNVGPTSEGIFPAPAVKILGEVGDWMRVNGESIYGTTRSPFTTQPEWGRITKKGNKFYLHVFKWPEDGKLVVNLTSFTATNAYLLANSEKLKAYPTQTSGGVIPFITTIELPSKPIDPIDTVVVLDTQFWIVPD